MLPISVRLCIGSIRHQRVHPPVTLLQGAGETPYSRSADGRAVLRSR
jgi:uncharacterized protein YdiU (UPF0061 family)